MPCVRLRWIFVTTGSTSAVLMMFWFSSASPENAVVQKDDSRILQREGAQENSSIQARLSLLTVHTSIEFRAGAPTLTVSGEERGVQQTIPVRPTKRLIKRLGERSPKPSLRLVSEWHNPPVEIQHTIQTDHKKSLNSDYIKPQPTNCDHSQALSSS